MAATFWTLGVIPIVFLAQIPFIVAFGVLLDAFMVRPLLVPALSHDMGDAIWLISKLCPGPQGLKTPTWQHPPGTAVSGP